MYERDTKVTLTELLLFSGGLRTHQNNIVCGRGSVEGAYDSPSHPLVDWERDSRSLEALLISGRLGLLPQIVTDDSFVDEMAGSVFTARCTIVHSAVLP